MNGQLYKDLRPPMQLLFTIYTSCYTQYTIAYFISTCCSFAGHTSMQSDYTTGSLNYSRLIENMNCLDRIEAAANELCSAVTRLANYCRNVESPVIDGNPPQLLLSATAPCEVHQARRAILSNMAKLQMLLHEPTDFLQQLAIQNQLLSCLHWLGEFQVLACIPLGHSVPFEDVAELAGVPEQHLSRVIRMMITAGFLQEPQPNHVAHSSLSTPFVTRPSYLDAAMFLSETAAPAALQMANATRRFGSSQKPHESAYNIAFNTPASFATVCEQRPQTHREWSSYLRYGIGDADANVMDVLTQYDWLSLGNAAVVHVGARSIDTVRALADLYPDLHFIVQMNEQIGSSRGSESLPKNQRLCCPQLAIQTRAIGSVQTIPDAAVYLIQLPSPSPRTPSNSIPSQLSAELRAHLGVARSACCAILIMTPRSLPKPGTVQPDIEGLARMRDLSLLQLANDREMEVAEVMDLIGSIRDASGRLVVVRRISSPDTSSVLLEVRYQRDV